jgi:hypothetical protein
MIAPYGRAGKRQDRYQITAAIRRHPIPGCGMGLTNSSITSYCCPISDKRAPSWNAIHDAVALGPGLPSSTRIPQPPAPRGLERIGPESIASKSLASKSLASKSLASKSHTVDPQFGIVSGRPLRRLFCFLNEPIWKLEFQWSVATAAPYIWLGLSRVPPCTITAASSMPSSNSWIGRLQVSLLPFQVPSFTQ